MKTQHEKNWTCEACVILAGTDASSGHSVMKNALFPRSEWSQYFPRSEWSQYVSQNSEHHVRMVAQSRRERMVAHDIADTSIWSPVLVIWRSFFERSVPIIIVVLGPPVVPIDEIQVEPCLMMAAFIRWSQAKCFFVGWRMHHACALSKNDENPVV